MLKPAASRQAVCDAGYGNALRSENLGEVVRCRLAFHIGAECQNDFRGAVFFDPMKKRINAELFGADVVERRESSTQRVVKSTKNTAAFERENIGCLFDYAEFFSLPSGLRADAAQFPLGEKSALAAGMDRGGCGADCLGELRGAGVFVPQKPKRAAFRAAWSKARETAKLAGELVERCRVVERHGEIRRERRPQF